MSLARFGKNAKVQSQSKKAIGVVFSVNLVVKEELNLLLEISLLPNNVGKTSANDTGPQQGHDSCCNGTIEQGLISKKKFGQK